MSDYDDSDVPDFEYRGLRFVQTSAGCPEQYDVFKGERLVGYVRLRWGALRCDFGGCGGETIYEALVGDGMSGSFPDDRERDKHLNRIAMAILRHLGDQVADACPHCGGAL